MTDTCPSCGQDFPEGLEWKYVRKLPNGRWEASAALGPFRGWALQKTEAEARTKALARLHFAKHLGITPTS